MCTIMNMVHPHIQISPESIKIHQKFTLCNIQIIPMIVEICKICTLWGVGEGWLEQLLLKSDENFLNVLKYD